VGELWSEYREIDSLVPALRNPRTHEIDQLRRSFNRFGFTIPPRIDERTGRLNTGHGRLQLLRYDHEQGNAAPDGVRVEANGTWWAPVTRGWSSKNDAEAEAALVSDNRLTQIAGWDNEKLVSELRHQQAAGGLEGIGFDTEDIDDLYAKLQERLAPTETPPNEQHSRLKSLVLDYPLDEYSYVAKTARRAREHYGQASNAELFHAMLSEFKEGAQ
jgi:hypothetical protein